MCGWAHYAQHAVRKHRLGSLANFAVVIDPLAQGAAPLGWKDFRRAFTTPRRRW